MDQENPWTIGNSSVNPDPVPSSWSRIQDKIFEQALVVFPEETPDRWRKMAEQLPGKSPWEIREHYEALVHDVLEIDSGRVELPCYSNNSFTPSLDSSECETTNQISFGSKPRRSDTERKKGIPWTEEEHKRFLKGLKIYGKGDWRSISRNSVVSRTPTQVASHAQKYYQRMNSKRKDKKRSSIHDITTAESNAVHVAATQSTQLPSSSQQHPWVGPSSGGFMVQQAMEPLGLPRPFLSENCMVVPPSSSHQQHSVGLSSRDTVQQRTKPEGLRRPSQKEGGTSGYDYKQFGFPM